MKKHRCDQAPPFMPIENKKWVEHAETDLRLTDESPQNGQASSLANGREGKPAHAEHQDIGNQQNRGDRGFVIAKDSGKLFAEGGERNAQAGAAFVAGSGGDAHERAADGPKLRARSVPAAANDSAQRTFPQS